MRLLFGEEVSYDHAEFYTTCARARTYSQHTADKNYVLEHTKPLFNKLGLLTLHHLYIYHAFLEVFKIIKNRTPIALFELFTPSNRSNNLLIVPKVKLDIAKHSIVFKVSSLWNDLIPSILTKCHPNAMGIMVPGSSLGSDMSVAVSVVHRKLKEILNSTQKLDVLNSFFGMDKSEVWHPENFF